MQKIDFSTIHDRQHTNSIKWNTENDVAIPMWIADMDFRCAEEILSELQNMISHGIFGYPFIDEEYFSAVTYWFNTYHGTKLKSENIVPVSGTTQALKAIIEEFSSEDDFIIIQPPTYYRFKSIIQTSKRRVLNNYLYYNDEKKEYEINFIHLNEIAEFNPKIFILCSPHNPLGRLWTNEELTAIGNYCIVNNILLVSDEAFCDLVFPGEKFISCATLPHDITQNSIILTSPAKTFNFSGIRGANAFVFNDTLMCRFSDRLMRYGSKIINPFYISAMKTGYGKCRSWLEDLMYYIRKNYMYIVDFININIPELQVYNSKSSYLLWINYSKLNISEEKFITLLSKRIIIIEGSKFGGQSEMYFRINIATSLQIIKHSMEALKEVVNIVKFYS